MSHNPIRECFILIIAVCFLALPIWYVTQPNAESKKNADNHVESSDATNSLETCWITMRFTTLPNLVKLNNQYEIIWEGSPKSTQYSFEYDLNLSENFLELTVEAQWKETETHKVIEVSIEPQTKEICSAHIWTQENANDILIYEW